MELKSRAVDVWSLPRTQTCPRCKHCFPQFDSSHPVCVCAAPVSHTVYCISDVTGSHVVSSFKVKEKAVVVEEKGCRLITGFWGLFLSYGVRWRAVWKTHLWGDVDTINTTSEHTFFTSVGCVDITFLHLNIWTNAKRGKMNVFLSWSKQRPP